MKKITILAAFALMAAGASAGQAAAPDSLWYACPMDTNIAEWSSGEKGQNWGTDRDLSETLNFADGKVAIFSDNDIYWYADPVNGAEDPGFRTYFVDLKANYTIGGLYVDNDSITYHISAADSLKYVLTGAEGARFEKRGSGVFYTDAPLKNVKVTELYEGTIARHSYRSRFFPVFGDSIVVKGVKASVDMGMNSDETGAKDAGVDISGNNNQYYRLGADVEVPEGSTLNLIAARYGYLWKDTVVIDGNRENRPVKVTGKGTFNFQVPGDRFVIGGGSKGEEFMGADFSEFYGTINVEKKGDDMIKMQTRKPGANDDGWEWVNDTIEMPAMSLLVFGPQTLKGSKVPGNECYSSGINTGASKLYDIWLNNRDYLDSVCTNMKNATLHVGNWGALACGSSGASVNVTIVRVGNLKVDPTGMVLGYYKASDNPRLGILFGSDNKDSYIRGTITGAPKAISVAGYKDDKLGRDKTHNHGAADSAGFEITNPGARLIKEGTGTCYITANDNQMKDGLEVYEGAVMFNNTEYTATGGVGGTVVCRKDGTIGGTGAIGCNTLLYGTLQPGNNTNCPIDTLLFTRENGIIVYDIGLEGKNSSGSENGPTHNLARGNRIRETKPGKGGNPNLGVYAAVDQQNNYGSAACFDMEIVDKNYHDMVDVEGDLQVYEAQNGTIKVNIAPRGSWELNDGDTIVLIKAKGEKCYEFEEGYYNENIEEDVSCFKTFELVPDKAFTDQGMVFELAELGTRTWHNYENPAPGTPRGYWNYPGGWQLVLVVKKGGKGEAEEIDAIEEVEETAMQVYPNPATDNVTVALPADATGVVAIYNLAGQLVKSVATSAPEVTVNVDDLTAGVYTVRIQTPDKTYHQRLIVK